MFEGHKLAANLVALSGSLLTTAALAEPIVCTVSTELPSAYMAHDNTAAHAAPHVAPTSPGDRPRPGLPHWGVHGQVVLGRDSPKALYHLPVFMADPWSHPHNFQVVVAVSPDEGDASVERYREERFAHPSALYTAAPPAFDQVALVYGHAGAAPMRRLDGVALFRNHFEDLAGRVSIAEVDLLIDRVVYFVEFDAMSGPSETLDYLLFANDGESFLVHLMKGTPTFDQVLAVEASGGSEFPLEQGVFIRFEGRANDVSERLDVGDRMVCGSEGSTAFLPIQITGELYCEVGEVSHSVGQTVNQPNFGPAAPCPQD